MDKRDRAEIFRQRLLQAIERAGLSRSALARVAAVDRSTIGQLLSGDAPRLPNAQLAADAASALGVSTDWLLGLTDRPERPGDVVAAAMTMTQAARTMADTQLLDWHREAAGYKIRHVPATLPDMLKTEEVLRWEYEAFLSRTPDQAVAAMQDRVAWLRASDSDYEIALPLHELRAFAEGSGYYAGLGVSARRSQLDQLARYCEEFFPALRLFLFDTRKVFSAPLTVFGPLLAVIYVGSVYLAFRERERVRSMATHFDWLVREATVDARAAAAHIAALRDSIAS
ncbi:helix-turn-helix domain-containing protein [Minwuia thermotolerans]|uniref:Transcriptional regulator n=1 Tax=Minwuia thermotolerans TaxID=2056226 RepID=A0A2M9G1I8_9PROT|nr:helix-turn-helix domain-containing protein [Minwuia thermotolerans]PJK29582.1 transcriptional regulator [Minwuia thermotolerans]